MKKKYLPIEVDIMMFNSGDVLMTSCGTDLFGSYGDENVWE